MDLDFLLFTPPNAKYTFMDFWGEVIFVPKMRKKVKKTGLAELLNCYKSENFNEQKYTINASNLQVKLTTEHESQALTQDSQNDEQIQKYIPCLFLNSMVNSKYIILYFHSSGEDIKLSHKFLNHLRNIYQINVMAMEYPGYSIYKGKSDSETIKEDAKYVYQFVIGKLGFKNCNIIVMGRSIGTGVALELMQKFNPGALALISPFASLKMLAKEYLGGFGHFFAKETYDNSSNIKAVNCPIFFLHGEKDETISVENTKQLAKLCHCKKHIKIPSTMTHSNFDFYSDLSQPLRQFLMNHDFNFYQPSMKGPQISEHLFQLPEGFKI